MIWGKSLGHQQHVNDNWSRWSRCQWENENWDEKATVPKHLEEATFAERTEVKEEEPEEVAEQDGR